MISALITILVIAIIAALIYWICDALPVPEPINRIVKVITIVVCVLAIIFVLLGIAGVDVAIPR